jgi:hypothetical protein
MALAHSQTQQRPREVTRSISRRASPMTYGRYRSILSETLVISKAVTVKLHRLREVGHLPVVLVIVRQVTPAMGPATRRTLMPIRPRSMNEICDLSLTVWTSSSMSSLSVVRHPRPSLS